MARRRSLLGGKKRTTGLPVPPRERGDGSSESETPPAEAAYGSPEPEGDPIISDAPSAANDATAASEASPSGPASAPKVSDEPAAEESLQAARGPEAPAAEVSAPSSVQTGQTGQTTSGDGALVEDDSPIIGEEIGVPPVAEGDDEPIAPERKVGHLHTPSPVPRSREPDGSPDEFVVFDDKPSDHPVAEPEVHVDDLPPGFESGEGLPSGTPEPLRGRASAPTGMAAPDETDWFHDEDRDPPTEEAQAATLEDLASMYRAPMNVPEPPPIPGILDRFTPAPAKPARPGDADAQRPDFVPTPPGGAEPPGIPRPQGMWDDHQGAGDGASSSRSHRVDSATEPPFWQDPTFLVMIVIAILLAVIVLGGALWFFVFNTSGAQSAVQPVPIEVPSVVRPPVDVRQTVSPTQLPPPDADVAGEGDADQAEPPEAEPSKAGADASAPGLESTAPPVRRTAPPRASPVAPVADGPGRLQVRATRRTLVYVNGQPVGMSPVNIEKPPGVYTVHIVDKGKKVEQRVDLESGQERTVDF